MFPCPACWRVRCPQRMITWSCAEDGDAGNAGSDHGAVLAVALVGRLVARHIVHGNVERPR